MPWQIVRSMIGQGIFDINKCMFMSLKRSAAGGESCKQTSFLYSADYYTGNGATKKYITTK